jgi:hypothetical protein
MKNLTNGDQWKEGHAVIETHIFLQDLYVFPLTVVASVKKLHPH